MSNVRKKSMGILGGSNMTGLIFFLNHNYQTLTCTSQSSVYSPPESTQFFQRAGHPDAHFKKGLWLAAYPLPNSLDDGIVRKLHALQV